MKQFKWPRPPLVLGLVLGDSIERYMFISIERYGTDWMSRPVVMILFGMAALGLIGPLLADARGISHRALAPARRSVECLARRRAAESR